MRRWLDRWRIARALDEGRALDGRLERRIAADPELRRHVEELRALERGLAREARALGARGARIPRGEPGWNGAARPAPAPAWRGPMARRAALVAAAAALLFVLATRRSSPPAGDADPPGAETAARVPAARADGAAWTSLEHLSLRRLRLRPSLLSEPEQALAGEGRKMIRDARRLAARLARRIPLVASGAGPDASESLPQ